MPDEPIDYDALVSEAIAEQGVPEEGDQPSEAAQGEPPAQAESTEEGEPTIDIGGRTLTLAQAQELLAKGEDYTKKTQQLAQQRKQLGEAAQIAEFWNDPNTTNAQRREFAKAMLGQIPDETPAIPDDYDSWAPETQAVYGENQALRKNLIEMQQVMNELKGFVQDQRMSQEASRKAQSMTSEYGVTVTDQDIRQAMRETGINDPEAAWLKLNHKKLLGAAKVQGVKEGSGVKPLAPRSQGNTFTLDDVGGSADEAMRRMLAGQQLVD